MIHVRYGTAEIIIQPALEARGDGGQPHVNYEMTDLMMAVWMVIGTTRTPAANFAQGIQVIAQQHGENPGGTQQ